MSSFNLYAASAPVFVRTLTAMKSWLSKAEALAAAKKFEPAILCTARLAPDMLSLTGQFHLATAFAKNSMCRLADQTPPDYGPLEDNFTAYRARIDQTLEIVGAIAPEALSGAESRQLQVKVGPDLTLDMNGQDYLLHFVLPNVYFHATTAYGILRHNGVELGKFDFMGAQK